MLLPRTRECQHLNWRRTATRIFECIKCRMHIVVIGDLLKKKEKDDDST
jgi:ribosomal protein L37AE/L43A